jgi:hypothetical protein
VDLALTSAGAAKVPASADLKLSEHERHYLSKLPRETRLLPRIRPEIEDRLQELNLAAQKDGLLMLTRKGRSVLERVGQV